MGDTEQGLKNEKIKLTAIGLFAGFINGLLGSGGGVLVVLYLTIIAGIAQKKAQATAIAVILPLTILSSVIYAKDGYVYWPVLWKVALGGIAGAIFGACLLNKIKGKFSKKLFGIFLIIAGLRMLFK
ncbi:MAG: sulfite exporter TauE/SafE family protein [Ruminiclostridium sp.]|nr:sulfite exporter TauE/SafE family protein [Ruminiclostridium sp.]